MYTAPDFDGNVPFINPDYDQEDKKKHPYFLDFNLNMHDDDPLPDHYAYKDQLFSLVTGNGSTYYIENRKYKIVPGIVSDGPFDAKVFEMTTVDEIKMLREKTGCGMMECKSALTESNGDQVEAVLLLRRKGLTDLEGRTHKSAKEGCIGFYLHNGSKIGVMVEVNCETDFAAKSEQFITLVNDIALHIAGSNTKYVSKEDVPQEVIDQEKSVMADTLKGKPENIADKIFTGKMAKFYKENCLMDQPFVKDDEKSIEDLIGELSGKIKEKIEVKRFVRWVVG